MSTFQEGIHIALFSLHHTEPKSCLTWKPLWSFLGRGSQWLAWAGGIIPESRNKPLPRKESSQQSWCLAKQNSRMQNWFLVSALAVSGRMLPFPCGITISCANARGSEGAGSRNKYAVRTEMLSNLQIHKTLTAALPPIISALHV